MMKALSGNLSKILAILIFALPVMVAAQGRRQISDDRDLKEIDLTAWDCVNKPGGSARTPDGIERNTLKNRSATNIASLKPQDMDIPGFLRNLSQFDSAMTRKHRKDLTEAERQQLDPMEKQIVQVTGYLGIAYCGPPETTNCASVDFHDWHLELFEKPPEHPPQIGDTTAIICEITPRTQNAIYADKIRIQELTAFFRDSNLDYESTGHPARKIRVIGYQLWDDDHNGSADVGTTVKRINPNKYHNPWRQTAWEIHPVIKIEALEPGIAPVSHPIASTSVPPVPDAASSATPQPSAAPEIKAPSPAPTSSSATQPQFVTTTQPVTINIMYGQATIPRGMKLQFISRDAQTVTVRYMGEKQKIPISSTDLQ